MRGGKYFEIDEKGARLFLRVTPGAARTEIVGLVPAADGHVRLGVKVRAIPDKGKANDAVISLLAQRLGLPKSALSVKAGATSRLKTVFIVGRGEGLSAALSSLGEDDA